MKIVEYKTASGDDLPELDKQVNRLIQDGFEPFGQQYFATTDKNGFFQPMIRKVDSN